MFASAMGPEPNTRIRTTLQRPRLSDELIPRGRLLDLVFPWLHKSERNIA